jgi:hypothetical protein
MVVVACWVIWDGLVRELALGPQEAGDPAGQASQVPFLLQDRPWERADVIAATAPMLAHDPQTEVVIAPPLRAAAASDLWQSPNRRA